MKVSSDKLIEFGARLDSFIRSRQKVAKDGTSAERKIIQAEMIRICNATLQPVDCTKAYVDDRLNGDFGAAGESTRVTSATMSTSAASATTTLQPASAPTTPAALAAAAGTTTTTKSGNTTTTVRTTKTDDGYQRITVRRDNSQAVNEDFSRYASVGPLTKQLAAFSKSAVRQVIPEASAASGQSYSFRPTAGSAGADVPVLEANVDGKVSFIKGSVPFDGTSVGRPVIASGSSIGAVNAAYSRAVAASPDARANPNQNSRSRTPAARNANVAGGSSDASSSGGGGSFEASGGASQSSGASSGTTSSASTSTSNAAPTASTGAPRVSGLANVDSAKRANQNVNTNPIIFPSVTDFHRALATAEKPGDFLKAQEISLRNWNLQVMYRGRPYPEKPDYFVKRRENYEEVKRMFTK